MNDNHADIKHRQQSIGHRDESVLIIVIKSSQIN